MLYCVCAFECNVYIGVFEEIGEFYNLWTVVCKFCPFFVFTFILFIGGFFVAFVLSGLLQVSPGNCFVPWLVLSSIQFVVFLLLVVVTSFW